MLDAVDYPYQEDSNGGLVHNGQNWWGYSWPQVEWFANIALKVDAGWGVLVCSHTPTRASHSLTGRMVPYSSDAIEGILKAFKAGTPFNPFDFTAQGKRDVIGFIAGHAHFDFAEIPADLGFPCINIACNEPSQIDNSLIPTGGLNPSRLIGTVTQDLWDVLVLRQDERKLHLIRFGAGNDVELSY
jgi:hypothetical protein